MHAVPTLNLGLWTKAYQWASEKKKIVSHVKSEGYVYFIPAGQSNEVTDLEETLNASFSTFEEFETVAFNIWTTTLPND